MSHFIWVLLFCVVTPTIAQYGEEQPPTEENPCNFVDCIPNTRCIVVNGEAKCIPLNGHGDKDCETPEPPTCATVLCKPPSTCVLRPKNPGCRDDCALEAACVIPVGDQQATAPKRTQPPAQEKCPANEQFNTCGSACEPSCKNPKPEICTLQCVVGCQCKPGFFRNDQNVCVAKCGGGGSGACGQNEERKQCGTACEPTCTNPNPGCTKQCILNVCQCKQGYLRDASNKCIPVGQCPKDRIIPCSEMNCPKGTVCQLGRVICPFVPPCFTQQTKCTQGDVPEESCDTTKCPPGTDCIQERIFCIVPNCRQPNPKCHKSQTSQQQCKANEVFTDCGSACEPSCKNPKPEICTEQCVVGCQCKPGFFRNDQGACVAKCSGGGAGSCGLNEERKQCGTACEPTCANPNPVCTKQCIINVCQCKQGYIRDASNKCIPVEQCPKDRVIPCSEMNCPPGTVCELGRVICPFVPPCFTQQTKCVPLTPKETCATKKCPPGTVCEQETIFCIRAPCPQPKPECVKKQPTNTCANVRCRAGTVCRMIDVVCKKAPCNPIPECVIDEPFNPCAATTCPVGSECRVKQVQCIRAPCPPIGECYTPPQSQQCGKNESFKTCASHCEPSCTNKSPICILSCAPPRCQCNQGFYRNSSGACVTEADCDGNADTNPYSRLR
ncbi:hypothetical protein Aduo_011453 [Ancylostoma duodenale]